jgi:hypothetical protein
VEKVKEALLHQAVEPHQPVTGDSLACCSGKRSNTIAE